MDMVKQRLFTDLMGVSEGFLVFLAVILGRPEILIAGKDGIGEQNMSGEWNL